MKLLMSLFAVCAIAMLWDFNGALSLANAGTTLEWTDDQGTVTFSDNPMTVPGKYSKKIKKRDAVEDEPPQVRLSPKNVQSKQEAGIYGGHDERWWRGQFSGTRAEIEKVKADLESKQQNLKVLHHKKVISNSSQTDGIGGNPRKNRENYRNAQEEIREDEERIKALEEKLVELENEAARHGVPLEWRR